MSVASDKVDLAYRNLKDGRTVLSWVAECGCIDSTRIILSSGRDQDIRNLLAAEVDHAGRSPVPYAAGWGHTEVLRLLCSQANIKNQFRFERPEDETPIAAAARSGHVEAVKILIIADPDNIDCGEHTVGRAPLSLAAHSESGGAAVAKLLQATGQLNVESKSDSGWTPLMYAITGARIEMIKVLIAEGKADTGKVICVEKGRPRLVIRPSATWEEAPVLHVLNPMIGSGREDR